LRLVTPTALAAVHSMPTCLNRSSFWAMISFLWAWHRASIDSWQSATLRHGMKPGLEANLHHDPPKSKGSTDLKRGE
jgi:hypothetical protein